MNGHTKALLTAIVMAKAVVDLAIAVVRLRAEVTRKRGSERLKE